MADKYIETGTFIDEIIENTLREINTRKAKSPQAQLVNQARTTAPPRDLVSALDRGDTLALVAEIKRASPYQGELVQAFDPLDIAQTCQANGADAVAVWTDGTYYLGNLTFQPIMRNLIDLPIIQKDFFIDPYQIYEARSAGADAIPLIVTVLQKEHLARLYELVTQLGMTPLLEVNSRQCLDRALELDPPVIVINNRDLQTFEIDMVTAPDLIKHIPENVIVVCESGFASPNLAKYVGEHGCHAVLVGSALMEAEDRAAAVRSFSGLPRTPRT